MPSFINVGTIKTIKEAMAINQKGNCFLSIMFIILSNYEFTLKSIKFFIHFCAEARQTEEIQLLRH